MELRNTIAKRKYSIDWLDKNTYKITRLESEKSKLRKKNREEWCQQDSWIWGPSLKSPSATIIWQTSMDKSTLWELWDPGRILWNLVNPRQRRAILRRQAYAQVANSNCRPSYRPKNSSIPPEDLAVVPFGLIQPPAPYTKGLGKSHAHIGLK